MITIAGFLMGLFVGAIITFVSCVYVVSEILKEDNHD
jgi:gas vesicle protein